MTWKSENISSDDIEATYGIFENAYIENGERIGTGTYGIYEIGIMIPTGEYPSFGFYNEASNDGEKFNSPKDDLSYLEFIRTTDIPDPIIGMPPPLGKGAPLKAAKALKGVRASDFFRTGKTVVSNQLIKGPGTPGAKVTWGIKGGGPNMGFHYHIHRYNWYKPWIWFKNTPIIKPPKP